MLGAHILSAVWGYNLYIQKQVVGETPDKVSFKEAYSYVRWATIATCGILTMVFLMQSIAYVYS